MLTSLSDSEYNKTEQNNVTSRGEKQQVLKSPKEAASYSKYEVTLKEVHKC